LSVLDTVQSFIILYALLRIIMYQGLAKSETAPSQTEYSPFLMEAVERVATLQEKYDICGHGTASLEDAQEMLETGLRSKHFKNTPTDLEHVSYLLPENPDILQSVLSPGKWTWKGTLTANSKYQTEAVLLIAIAKDPRDPDLAQQQWSVSSPPVYLDPQTGKYTLSRKHIYGYIESETGKLIENPNFQE